MRSINRICPYCGEYMIMDIYKKNKKVEIIIYCDNDKCEVKPCTDSGSPTRVYAELLAITGQKE